VKLFPHLNINGVFFLFAGLCAVCGVFVYFVCPETKGVLPEFVEVKSPVDAALFWPSL
jgi:hypothetical protein